MKASQKSRASMDVAIKSRIHKSVGQMKSAKHLAGDESRVLNRYVEEIGNHDLISRDDEVKLARALEKCEIEMWERVLAVPTIAVDIPLLFDKEKRSKFDDKPISKAARAIRKIDPDRAALERVVKLIKRNNHEKLFVNKLMELDRKSKMIRDRFTTANLRIVMSMAGRYNNMGMELEDLIQEGNIGLMSAVGRFNPRLGFKFSTYAAWWIRHAIGRGLSDKSRTVKVPVHVLDSITKVKKTKAILSDELGRNPSNDEIATRLKCSVERVDMFWELADTRTMSVDVPVHDDSDSTFVDTMSSKDEVSVSEQLASVDLGQRVVELLERTEFLKRTEKEILKARFGLGGYTEGMTMQEVGDKLNSGCTRERIRQIQVGALETMKMLVGRELGVKEFA